MREELLLVTAPTHPLAKRKRVTPQDLVGQPFVLFEAGSGSRKAIEEFFVREQIAPKVVTETENVEIIKALVQIGMGITIIPYRQWRARFGRDSCSAADCRPGNGARDRVGSPAAEPRAACRPGDDADPRARTTSAQAFAWRVVQARSRDDDQRAALGNS